MKKIKNKKVIILAVLLVIVISGTVFALNRNAINQTQKSDQQILREEEKKANTDPKRDNESNYRNRNSGTVPAQANTKSTIKPIITTHEQIGERVIIDASVGNASSGSCTAAFSYGGQQFEQTNPVVMVATYYACQTFEVPIQQFNPKGTWQVVVKYQSETATGQSDSVPLEIK